MFKFLKKPKVIKFITMMLVIVFCINVTGCSEMEENGYNGVETNRQYAVGVGSNTVGYTVYAESTFDPMTKELFMGYLLSGREFTLVVVPGSKSDEEYVIGSADNYLYASAQTGVYAYNDKTGEFTDPTKKLLLYYITDDELRDWFSSFESKDNFLNSAMNFLENEVDVEDYSRYTCKKLVNMGGGLSANDFCDYVLQNKELKNSKGEVKERPLFNDNITGGMILLFGYSSIEGYLTYEDINAYEGSEIANSLSSCNAGNSNCFNVNKIEPFNIGWILRNIHDVSDAIAIDEDYEGYSYSGFTGGKAIIKAYQDNKLNGDAKNAFIQKVVQIYTEYEMSKASRGYGKLAATYNLLGSALLTDSGKDSISALKSSLESISVENRTDLQAAQYDMVKMLYDFRSTAHEEAFNIKLSVALYSRYSSVKNYPSLENLVTGQSYGFVQDFGDNYNGAKEYIKGKPGETYLMMVTADGFVLDRGTEEDQILAGSAEMLGMGTIMAELVRMDACPNATMAAEMFNMLANLKIAAGIALTVAGVSAVAVAAVGLTAAAVIAKVAAVSAVTPVPGARIVALVLVAIAGLVAIGAGVYTLFSGLKDKARVKGLGASETNYCKTYKATFNSLFESLELTIPVYHYEVPAEDEEQYNENLSLRYCDDNGENCKQIELYYYADVQQTKELSLEGAPMLMYFENGSLRDYIYGASTPSYIVEMLRLWGLLAMREVVYRAQVDWNTNKISVSHTTNTSSLTHTIKEAKYCINLDYGASLYSSDANCVISDMSTYTPDYVYYKISGKTYKYYDVEIPDISSLTLDSMSSLADYKSQFTNTDFYRMNEYLKKNNIQLVEPTDVTVKPRIPEGQLDFVFDILDSSLNVVDTIDNYEVIHDGVLDGRYYISKGDTETTIYYRANLVSLTFTKIAVLGNTVDINDFEMYEEYTVSFDGNKINFLGINSIIEATYDYTVVYDNAKGEYKFTINNQVYYGDSLNPEKIRLVNEDYTPYNLLQYIKGDFEFENTTIEVPFYFTSTVAETSLTQSHPDVNKTCKDGKYLYSRYHEFLGASWTTDKCLSLDQVTSKDTPYESELKYYTTSVLVGYITLTIGKGTTDLVASARYLNQDAE